MQPENDNTPNDVSGDYMAHRESVVTDADIAEFQSGLAQRSGDVVQEQPKQSTLGKVVRSFSESPRQAVGGFQDALLNTEKTIEDIIPYTKELNQWLNEEVGDIGLGVQIAGPKTKVGSIVRSASQFLTGFIPAMRGMEAIGATGMAAPIVSGFISDFVTRNPADANLSDLWKQLGLPENILTDYLASDPNDSRNEARLKKALEGAGLGVLTEGIFRGIRWLRAAHKLKSVQKSQGAYLKQTYGDVSDQSFKNLGNPKDPLFTVTKKLGKALDETAGAPSPQGLTQASGTYAGDVYVNFSRINGEQDVKTLIKDMANTFSASIKKGARGVQSHEQTQKLAEEMGLTWQQLLQRNKGQPLNAETAFAARKIWAASAEKLLELAKRASGPEASAIDQFNFRKMLALHHAIQSEVIGARTETARALNAWAIPAGSGVEKARGVQMMLDAAGGIGTSKELASRLAILSEAGATPKAIAQFAERGAVAKTVDAIKEVWVNGLLSLPSTHIVNTTSNTAVAIQQIYERKVGEMISGSTGGGVAPGEAAAIAHGYLSAMKDAFRISWRAIKTGETGTSLNKLDLPRPNAISSRNFNLDGTGALGGTVDFLGHATQVPGRLLGAEDEFFKTIGYRAELHAQAVRQAYAEGLSGNMLKQRAAAIVADPPDFIRIAAADHAMYATFTNKAGWFGQWVMKGRNADSLLNPLPWILPFVRTPVNIARYTFERTPLAPVVGQWRADIAAGGARADLAMARMATGTAAVAIALDMADNGLISGSGPQDPAERAALMREGWKPYAVNAKALGLGNYWISYNRLDPMGSQLGIAADIASIIRHSEIQQEDQNKVNELIAMSIAATSQVAINKTYLRGMANFVDMMQHPQQYDEKYAKQLVTSFIPGTALVGGIERMIDPTVRETNSISDAVRARIFGLSSTLPPRRDLWGTPITTESGLGKTYDFFSPMYASPMKESPIDSELVRLAESPTRGTGALPMKIRKGTVFNGVRVNLSDWPDVYDEYVKLAGNELKDPAFGLGCKDYLNSVVTGNNPLSTIYRDNMVMSDEGRLGFIQNTISRYRQMAQQEILNDPLFADFKAYVDKQKAVEQALKIPALGQQQ